MADGIMTEQQMARLLAMSGEDFNAEMTPFIAGLSNKEEFEQAVQANDFRKLQEIVLTAPAAIDTSALQKMQAAIQRKEDVHRVVEANRVYNKLNERKNKRILLKPKEQEFLDKKPQIEAWNQKILTDYPEAVAAVAEGPLPQRESEQIDSIESEIRAQAVNTAELPPVEGEKEAKENPLNTNNEQLSYTGTDTRENDSSFIVTHPIDEKALNPDYIDSTVPDKTGALDSSTVEFNPVDPIYRSDELESGTLSHSPTTINKTVDFRGENDLGPQNDSDLSDNIGTYNSGIKDKDPYDSLTGDTDYQQQAAHDLLNAQKEADGPGKLDKVLDDLEYEGKFGHAGDWQFKDKKEMDWLPIFEKTVFDPMKKFGGEKDIGDLVINLGLTALTVPVEFMAEALKQRRANKKEEAKKTKENRENAIDGNLKQRGLNRNDLASKLARDAKMWILADPAYANLPEKGPYTKAQKALKAKMQFAESLPRTPNGDLNWGKMSSKQQKQYANYMGVYASTNKWLDYMCEVTGVNITKKEWDNYVKIAKEMKIASPQLGANKQEAQQQAAESQVAAPQLNTPKAENKATQQVSQDAAKPVTARSEEEMRLQQEAEKSKKLEPLDDVKVSGTLKNPVVQLPNGSTVPVTDENLDDIKRETKRLEREKAELNEKQAQNARDSRAVEQAKAGAQQQQQSQASRTMTGNTR